MVTVEFKQDLPGQGLHKDWVTLRTNKYASERIRILLLPQSVLKNHLVTTKRVVTDTSLQAIL
jgi:hypothetical protein